MSQPQQSLTLLTPAPLGPSTLPNRMVMAPMTRSRAGEGLVPTEMMATYYRQRASAGLVITEATQGSPQAGSPTRDTSRRKRRTAAIRGRPRDAARRRPTSAAHRRASSPVPPCAT